MTGATHGHSLELFFIDGKPDGMLMAEVFNWTGRVLMTPRTQIDKALKRDEAKYTGVYLLFGEQEGEPLGYIGESEDISKRIRDHDLKKDWWTKAIFITASANNLNKAHVKYLEARLVEEAAAAGRIELENGTTPSRPSLSEADQAKMEVFLSHIFLILPAIRIDSFLQKTRATPSMMSEEKPEREKGGVPVFELNTPKHGIHGSAVLEDGEFVVVVGSLARKKWAGKSTHSYAELYAELVKTGVLIEGENNRIFAENYAFKSPSAAGAILNGRATNGQIEWRLHGSTKTYQEWEAEKLAK